ncbi:recombinase family protein [Kitasatospora sp. NPDC004669]|uniref:recombinase family protein n=1 Tax=Kitasatospora sp. NPDC004669 TaxID=3154555 RepID=UPI0033B3FAC0
MQPLPEARPHHATAARGRHREGNRARPALPLRTAPGDLGAELRERGVGPHVIEQGIDTATTEGRAMSGMPSVLAELQRGLIVADTNDGLASARARGPVDGRRPGLTDDQAALAQGSTPWPRPRRPYRPRQCGSSRRCRRREPAGHPHHQALEYRLPPGRGCTPARGRRLIFVCRHDSR